jgi:hypothetical protein
MDSGANIHVCADASMFSSYQVGKSGAIVRERAGRHHRLSGGASQMGRRSCSP